MSLGNKTKKELYDAAKELSDENKKLKKENTMLLKKLEKLSDSTVDEDTLDMEAVSMGITKDLKKGIVYDLKFNATTGQAKVVSTKEHPSTAYAAMDMQEKVIKIEGQILKGE